jgi:hypothetical protein
MQPKILFSFLAFSIFFSSSVDGQVGIGEWRTHLPYQNTTGVMVTDDRVFCASTGGLFYYDLRDNSVATLSKSDGLSDNGVGAMAWNNGKQLALIAYSNANLDVLRENRVINIPDIMKKQIPGDKTVYNIFFIDEKAYLSCGFGIVVLDLEKYEIAETYYIGDNGDQLTVNQVTSDGTWLYAATDEGVRRAELSNPFLIDFNSWELIGSLPDPYGKYAGIAHLNGRIYVVYSNPGDTDDRVYYYDGAWKEAPETLQQEYSEIRRSGESLVFTGEEGVRVVSKDFLVLESYNEGRPRSATWDENGILWIADFGRGLVRYENDAEQLIRPNGPFSAIAYKMADGGGILYTVSGGITSSYNNVFRSGILQQFYDETWRSNIRYEFQDLISLVVDPSDPAHVFAASWGYGLVEYIDGKPENIYRENNSSLQNAVPGGDVVRIGGLAYDQEENLWMTNTAVSEPISVLKSDGTWKSFRVDGMLSDFNALGEILVSAEGHLWGIIPKGGGLFAMDFNGTIDEEEDDTYKLLSIRDENGNVITNEVFSFAEDLNGNIWLGTNQGILVLYSPGRLFTDGQLFAREIIVPRNDGTIYGDPLLQTEKVTAIEVDGSNRKWIGTADGGAFLVSENGFEQIYNFNTGTSPILSNSITDICVEGNTGEVFFGTDKGIVSFKGTATEGASSYADVKVYPNPVRENYNGPIAISGLIAETTVKITDISGNLVNELNSFGGQAIWDGNDFNGNRVATGTYLLFLANRADRNNMRAHVAKILFIH